MSKMEIYDQEEIEIISEEEDIKQFLNKYAIIKRGSKTEIFYRNAQKEFEFFDIKDFHEFHKKHNYIDYSGKFPRKYYISKLWQEHPNVKQYYNIVFDPSSTASKSYLNLWKGWSVKPLDGDIKPFLELVSAICNDNKEGIEYLLDYLAHMIQFPHLLPEVAIVMQSDDKGVGKGTLMKLLHRLTDNYKHLQKRQELVGDFTGHLADSFILFCDELTWAGNKAESDVLKGIITEETVTINAKHKDLIQVKNFKRLFIASNNAFCAPVELDDRRFCVFSVNPRLKYLKGWFKDFNENYIMKDGPSILMKFLLDRDISNFDTRIFPTTEARIELMKRNLTPVQKFIYELFNGTAKISNTTEVKMNGGYRWYRSGLVSDCYEWFKETNTTYYDQTLKDDISKTLNKIFEFTKDNPKWSHNWKNRTGSFYQLHGTKKDLMEKIAKNMFADVNPQWIFEEYSTEFSEYND